MIPVNAKELSGNKRILTFIKKKDTAGVLLYLSVSDGAVFAVFIQLLRVM